jgi:hypothetical protein
MHSESRCALTKGVGSYRYVHEHLYWFCYSVWEEVRFFSDHCMSCCKPNIFRLRVRNVHQLLIVNTL